MLLTQPIHAHVAAAPQRVAFSDGETDLTWSELLVRVQRTAHALIASGIGTGDRVGLAFLPSLGWYETFVGLLYIGAIPNLLPPDLSDAELAGRARRTELERVLKEPVRGDDATDDPGATRIAAGATMGSERTLYEVWTSGTTGEPRVNQITTRQALFSAWGAASRLGFVPGERWLLCLPTHHVGGASIVLRSLFVGYSVVLSHPFDASRVNELIDRGAVQHASVVPTMLQRLVEDRGDVCFPASLRSIMSGGAATPRALVERATALGAPLALTWGMSETGSHVATAEPGDIGEGAPLLPFMSARANESTGRVHVSGPVAPAPDFATNDLGAVARGRVRIRGRADRVFISGGENTDPARIEATLRGYPGVRAVAVVDLHDDEWGARPHAFYESEEALSPQALRAYLAERLLPFEVPDTFTRLTALPQNSTGKTDFPALRALLPVEQDARSEDRPES